MIGIEADAAVVTVTMAEDKPYESYNKIKQEPVSDGLLFYIYNKFSFSFPYIPREVFRL